MKKVLFVLLAAVLLLSCFGVAALAAEDVPEAATYEEMVALVREGLLAREETIRFRYTGDDYRDPSLDDLCAYGEDGAAGDYLRLSFNGAFPAVTQEEDGSYTVTASYYTTAQQEAAVAEYVAAAMAGCEAAEDETKARFIYDYLCDNVLFDLENLYDETDLMKYTAYGAVTNGKAVCQGFAQLYYRMAKAAGLDCRIVTGTRAGENHAWNIVKFGDQWYHVDASCGAQLLDNTGYFKKPLFPFYSISYDENATAAEIADYSFPAAPPESTVQTGTLGGNISWTLDKTTGVLEIMGSGAIGGSSTYSTFSFNRSIKSVVIWEGITSIGKNLFHYCEKLQSASLPASVTYVAPEAFKMCYDMTALQVDPQNAVYHSAGNCLIHTADKRLVVGAGGCAIPDDGSVEVIGPLAFYGRLNLSAVVIPNCITEIQKEAFLGTDVKTLRIPDSVTKLGLDAFASCRKLETVTIGTGLSAIDGKVLYGYPAGGSRAYSETAPYAFHECPLLRSVTVDENNAYFSSDARGAFFDKDKTVLIRYPAGNAAAAYTIPDTVSHIGDAFYWADDLREVTIPAGVTAIADYAFYCCKGLTTVHFSEGLTAIGNNAFDSCISLADITFPESLRMILLEAFRACESLDLVVIPDGVTTIDERAFSSCRELAAIVIPDSVTRINTAAFTNCSKLTIYGHAGSYAQEFAGIKNIPFKEVCTVSNGLHRATPMDTEPATCEESARTAGERCADCGAWLSGHQPTGDPLGHDPAEAVRENIVEPTCTAEGSYDSVIYCARCGAVLSSTPEKLAMTPHRDDVLDGYCDDCGAYICDHAETAAANEKAATCTENGYSGDIVCAVCGVTLTYGETVYATGHTPVLSRAAVAATCLAKGSTEEYTCSACGTVITPSRETPLAGHTDTDGDSLCDVCRAPVSCERYGVCGDDLYWYIAAETLIVSGSGASYDLTQAPWADCADAFDCVYLREGISSMDGTGFNGCGRVKKVFAPSGAVVSGCEKPLLTYTFTDGTVFVSGATGSGACDVYDILNMAYLFCLDHEVAALRFDALSLTGADGAEYTEYDILRTGKIIDERHFRLPSGAALTDLTVRPMGYVSFNSVLEALGSHPDRNLILGASCADLLPEELRPEADAYTVQMVVRFVDEPVQPPAEEPEKPDGDGHMSFIERFRATLAAILALFKKIIKLFTRR